MGYNLISTVLEGLDSPKSWELSLLDRWLKWKSQRKIIWPEVPNFLLTSVWQTLTRCKFSLLLSQSDWMIASMLICDWLFVNASFDDSSCTEFRQSTSSKSLSVFNIGFKSTVLRHFRIGCRYTEVGIGRSKFFIRLLPFNLIYNLLSGGIEIRIVLAPCWTCDGRHLNKFQQTKHLSPMIVK
jgi:hypothetical protein